MSSVIPYTTRCQMRALALLIKAYSDKILLLGARPTFGSKLKKNEIDTIYYLMVCFVL